MPSKLLATILAGGVFFFSGSVGTGYCQNQKIEDVYVIFKTHLDIGYTDLSSRVTEKYLNFFIPKALDNAQRFKKQGGGDRYVWTTGSWLIWEYLQHADAQSVEKLKKALREGDITYTATPFTYESEVMSGALFRASLLPAKRLDRISGKRTIVAKMTDVPGHTRSIITPLVEAGILLMSVGTNRSVPIPQVPAFFRWRNTNGKEIMVMYQGDYGGDVILPDGKTAVSICFTGDNCGPHNFGHARNIFRAIHRRYPKAKVTAASMDTVAEKLLPMRDKLPVVTSEIGDTWIHGYPSAPQRMRNFRAMDRLFTRWVEDRRIDLTQDRTLSFILALCQIPEHTAGFSTCRFTKNYDKYDPDLFMEARRKGIFRMTELSWKEKSAYIDTALGYLPESLRLEAKNALAEVAPKKDPADLPAVAPSLPETTPILSIPLCGGELKLSGLTYRCYDSDYMKGFLDRYIRKDTPWMEGSLLEFGKPGLEQSKVVSATLPARIARKKTEEGKGCRETAYSCGFSIPKGVDPRILPRGVALRVKEIRGENKAELELTLYGKPAVRYPEAYWFTFDTAKATRLIAEKVGEPVDLSDVVANGARHEHGIDRYVDIVQKDGTYRITSKDAMLIGLGDDPGLNFSTSPVEIHKGLHFNLCNNLWGTNFCMWNEGTLTYRFTVEKIK